MEDTHFIKPEIVNQVYSLYLKGLSVEDIVWCVNTGYELEMNDVKINGIIDYINSLL